jgi:hypothetical protein
MRYAYSLILAWRVAAFEARNLKASLIDTTHLLLGLLKVVDLDLPELVSKDLPDRNGLLEELLRDVRRLRTVFRAAGLDAKIFRRRLRHASPEQRFVLDDSERLHRSSDAKRIFADAERFAQLGSGVVYPVHLLYAILLAKDSNRDAILAELKVDRKRLLTLAKIEVLKPRVSSAASSKRRKARLN